MVLLNDKTLVLVALGPKNELEYKLLLDVKAKKSEVIAFSDIPVEYAQFNYGHPLSHIALGIPFIVLCQMIAYKKSLQTGADPDKPTGLDAWISL
jgi:glucosamine 6-phosphate synthetase-like amidotransferase/phosphosugar isomerase protein